jgi:hypothetical protein
VPWTTRHSRCLTWTLPGVYLECRAVTWILPGLHQDRWGSVKYCKRAKRAAAMLSTQPETAKSFVDADRNSGTKHLELLADGTARAVKHQRTHSTVEDVEEDDIPVNLSPKNPNALLEAADGSNNVEMPNPTLQSSGEDDDEDGEGITKAVETAEEQCRELMHCKKTKTDSPIFCIRTDIR